MNQVQKELTESALKGIQEYLRSTRGANLCGAKATAEINEKGEIVVNHGDTTWFTPITI